MAFIPFALGHWRAIGIGVAAFALFLYVGTLKLELHNARAGRDAAIAQRDAAQAQAQAEADQIRALTDDKAAYARRLDEAAQALAHQPTKIIVQKVKEIARDTKAVGNCGPATAAVLGSLRVQSATP
jgi:hypothetical protein